MVCPRGHSFDIARRGYVNLLQPQDRRSKQPGDATDAIAARRRLHDRGVTNPSLTAIAELIAPSLSDAVLDVGCGDGFYLGNLARQFGFDPHGIDISIPAIRAAAGRYPECEWIVANADRFIPCSDRSFSVVMSITARMNPLEFRRILCDHGLLLVAIPGPDDLIELRRVGRDRVARTVETFAHGFRLLTKRRTTTMAHLDSAAINDLLVSIYRPMRSGPVEASRVTFSLDLLLFRAEKS